MNEILNIVSVFFAGSALGMLFFGGLWLTVKKAVTSSIPALWFFASFILRIGITLAGFYYLTIGNWQRVLICLFGFVVARFVILKLTKWEAQKQVWLKKEVNHEA